MKEVAVQSGDTRSFTSCATRLLSSEYVTAQWPLGCLSDGSLASDGKHSRQLQNHNKKVHAERQYEHR